jgi:IMP cyclohydrolase
MLEETALQNLQERLAENPYPGRGIVVGCNEERQWIQVYWIMGRSANSRNRIFVYADEMLRTQAADPAKVADPSLIIYSAMRHLDGLFIVTNGAQTDGIYEGSQQGRSFAESLLAWQHEPDAPNFTPRISGLVDRQRGAAWLSVIKASPFNADQSEHHFFHYAHIQPGYGYAITTYRGDGEPLPAFTGSPYLLPLQGDAAQIATRFWETLDADNKISLAVRQIDPQSGEVRMKILNKYSAIQE